MHDVPVCIVRDWKFSTPVNVGRPFFAAFNLVLDVRDRVLLLDADPEILATSLHGPLRASQHFDLLDVAEVERRGRRTRVIDLIDIETHATF